MPIDRGFYRLEAGLIHYRLAGRTVTGGSPPLVLAHGGPGSSAALLPLIDALSHDRQVIAPDMMGNGDSDPPPGIPSIGFYAGCLIALLDGLGIATVDLYGHHTGAQVVCEVAIACPERVGKVVLDGIGLFAPSLRAELLEHYAVPIVPDADGGHLPAIWDFAAHLSRYFPHYRRDEAHRIVPEMVLAPDAIMNIVRDIAKAWPTVHLAYRAAFEHRLESRLPLVVQPALVLAVEGDPLALYAPQAANLLPRAMLAATTRADRALMIETWLAD